MGTSQLPVGTTSQLASFLIPNSVPNCRAKSLGTSLTTRKISAYFPRSIPISRASSVPTNVPTPNRGSPATNVNENGSSISSTVKVSKTNGIAQVTPKKCFGGRKSSKEKYKEQLEDLENEVERIQQAYDRVRARLQETEEQVNKLTGHKEKLEPEALDRGHELEDLQTEFGGVGFSFRRQRPTNRGT
ncbi:hypothetical protein FKW77_004783 [Venturia effusa]|uniref:Uncharacterized protein n=1 Tax=Venturia effusa TaxID=50376 RepID=A0A517LAW6_9PEZI|nr:hypothetical protein FKW77_004783 [Venturia effusa]